MFSPMRKEVIFFWFTLNYFSANGMTLLLFIESEQNVEKKKKSTP